MKRFAATAQCDFKDDRDGALPDLSCPRLEVRVYELPSQGSVTLQVNAVRH